MVSVGEENLIYGIKLSSVGPARVTSPDVVHEPTSMDLAMKLHYLRGVYYYRSQAVQGLTIKKIKETMFTWLNRYYMANGRFRRSESGRPFVKCNDCGTRMIEAQCVKTLDQWLEMMEDRHSLHKLLVSDQVLGPEIAFSPLVLIQLTWFKCGGMSVGLSWAHVLGDAFSASDYINMWGQVLAGHDPNPVPDFANSPKQVEKSINPAPAAIDPLSVKRVDPVGDHWIYPNNYRLETFSFHITGKQLTQLQSKVSGQNHTDQVPSFESLCAIIWKCMAQNSEGSEPKTVTLCKNNPHGLKDKILSNNQTISVVKAEMSIVGAKLKELAALLVDQAITENNHIEEAVERDGGLSDFIVYGSNLTFVNWEEATFYGLEIKGQEPILVNYTIDGIGDNGVVLVLPGPKNSGETGSEERIVTVILPENRLLQLKSELKRECMFA
ncbi:hypothetical protein L1049_016566 [Liquidambar formosana]|uniref:Protein ECERIFERUM 26-like n=1 Tax=Liquidambar formosana TaxID=63359 RepID=A0AAP0S1L0_LIQFO